MRKEEAELRDLTILKRLMALYKRKGSRHLQIALTDEDHIELVNLFDWLGLLEDPDIKWLVEFSQRRAERKSVLQLDELTRLALSLSDEDVNSLLSIYRKRVEEIVL